MTAQSRPTVTTPTSASIAATTATLGGNVTAAGDTSLSAVGVVYAPTASNANPLLNGTGVINVTGSATVGVFTVSASGLTSNTAYTYAAYATTSVGTTYSSTGTFTTVNVAPTLAAIADPAAILEEAGAQTVNLTGIAAGGGDTQVLTVTATSSNTALIPNPTVTYTSPGTTGSLSYTPVANANGTAIITVTVTDDGGTANSGVDTTTQTFTVAVTAVNDAPTLTTVSTLTGATEDTPFTISYATLAAAANAADVDGDALSFRVEALTTGTLTAGGVAVVAGTTLLSTGQDLVWTPAANANGTLSAFTIKAWDGTTISATAIQVQVTVAAVNDAPVAGADTLTRLDSTRVTKVLLTTLLANDTDPENDTLSITAVGSAQPVGATVSISGRFAVYVAPVTTSGNGSFTYTLSDGTALVTSTVTVTETSSIAAAGSPNSASLVMVGSDCVLKFLGVPGWTYRVYYTTDTAAPYTWNEFLSPVSRVAPDSGVMGYTDVNPADPIRFYRVVLQP